MKLPIISGKEAVKAFEKLGYAPVRQKGSHMRSDVEILTMINRPGWDKEKIIQ